MPLHSFIGQIWLDGYALPLETFAAHGYWGDGFLGSPSGWGADSFLEKDDVVVEGPEFVDDGGIFFVDDVLFPKFKFELVAGIKLKLKVDDTYLNEVYFSSQPFRLL